MHAYIYIFLSSFPLNTEVDKGKMMKGRFQCISLVINTHFSYGKNPLNLQIPIFSFMVFGITMNSVNCFYIAFYPSPPPPLHYHGTVIVNDHSNSSIINVIQ